MKLKDWFDLNKQVFIERDLRFLMRKFLGENPCFFLSRDIFLDEQNKYCLEKIKELYLKGTPLPYLLGKEEFYGLEFKVSPAVLIPRKETELIVEEALNIIKHSKCKYVLDLCCGSGNISISLKKNLSEDVTIVASDISGDALAVAGQNCDFHQADVKLINTDLFSGFGKGYFDMIVTNPPYVETKDIYGTLEAEPKIALNGGRDGLAVIRKILTRAPMYLKEDGFLIIEIGYNQKNKVGDCVENSAKYRIIKWIKDYDENWRGIVLKTKM